MYIIFSCLGMPFSGNTIPSGKSLGGSESACYYIAKELAALGHDVSVFTRSKERGTFDGVRYEWCGEESEKYPLGNRYAYAIQSPVDVIIAQRHPKAFDMPTHSKLNVLWLHDLLLMRTAQQMQDSLVNTDQIFAVSQWHKNQITEVLGVDRDFIYATKNGVDYDQVKEALAEEPIVRQPKTLCFASRPERGLEALVGHDGIMEKLPDYHLYVCGYNNTTPQMATYYQQLYQRCEALPNVTNVGHLGKKELYRLLASCQATVYPTMFEDTSNIISIESAACGTPFIGVDNGAAPETTRFHSSNNSFASMVPTNEQGFDIQAFVNEVKNICEDDAKYQKKLSAAKKFRQSWKDIAKDWVEFFDTKLEEKSNVPDYKMIKHLEKQSDIMMMRHFYADDKIEEVLPDFKTNYRFLIENDFKEHYRQLYEYEKNRGQIYGPEDLRNHPRFKWISSLVNKHQPKTLLDYGCAHGPYSVNLAKLFPDMFVEGIDIAQSNVDIANKWVADEGLENVTHRQGEHHDVEGTYDMIIASEVLEHLPNPQEVVERLLQSLSEGGTMLISTPYGPWEAIGYAQHPGQRAHIHHFERQDLKDLFGHFPDYHAVSIPSDSDYGWFVATFKKPEHPCCGQVDYYRKIRQQKIPETLSVCMIARDEADNIGKCLRAMENYADEIIIGIDNTTTDNTKEIAESFGAKCFDIPSPLEIGFDEARNLTIAKAKSDWILWIDADETLENGHILPDFLRSNIYDGYGVKQHHFSVEVAPPGALQVDMPVRLFRNRGNIKFFGVVHEHPSLKPDMNAGPGRIYVLPTIHIAHIGYATEDKRRKRFQRNYPLIVRDRQKYPKRELGKFLFVRDLAHCIRYEREMTGGFLTEKSYEAAEQAVSLWNEMLETVGLPQSRYLLQALPYYTECVMLLGGKVPLQGTINGLDIKALFMDTDIARKFLDKILLSTIEPFGKKYL